MSTVDLLLAVICIQPILFLVVYIHGYRLSRYLDGSVTSWRACEAISLSLTLGLLLPARMGELIKPLYLQRKSKVPFSFGCGAILVERVFDLLFFILISFLVLSWGGVSGGYASLGVFIILLCGILLALIIFLVAGKKIAFFFHEIGLEKLANFLYVTLEGMQGSLRHAFSIDLWIVGALAWAMTFAIYYLFFYIATNGAISLIVGAGLYVAGTLGMGVAITPGSLGSFEAALSGVLVHQGFDVERALLIAIVFRVASSLPAALVALVVIMRDADLVSDLKHEALERGKRKKPVND